MLFLVHIDVSLPASVPQAEKDALRAKENDTAIRYMKEGKLRRIWRIVGQTANYGLWEAKTLEELHATIGGLPLYPYMKVVVTPLIAHPVTEAWTKEIGDLLPF
jgi:muconolactone D-isomerase